MAEPPIKIREADLPEGVVVIASPVHPHEVLPGETLADAMVRLRRVVVIHTDQPAASSSQTGSNTTSER